MTTSAAANDTAIPTKDPFGIEIIPHDLSSSRVVIISGAWSGQLGTVTGIIKANGAYRVALDRDVQTAFDRTEFVVLRKRAFPDRPGMKVSLAGVITRLPGATKADMKGYNWVLSEHLKHMREMARRYYAGDTDVVDEFLQLYDLDDTRKS